MATISNCKRVSMNYLIVSDILGLNLALLRFSMAMCANKGVVNLYDDNFQDFEN
jgi:hypothetical protein